MELRTRYRAVTAEDFEYLCRRGLAARRPRALPGAVDGPAACACTSSRGSSPPTAAGSIELIPDEELMAGSRATSTSAA